TGSGIWWRKKGPRGSEAPSGTAATTRAGWSPRMSTSSSCGPGTGPGSAGSGYAMKAVNKEAPMRHGKILILFCLTLAGRVLADQAGASGRPFLLLPPDARGSAMGGSFSALGDGAPALFNNPAALSTLDRGDLGLTHLSWFGGANLESAAYAQPIPG